MQGSRGRADAAADAREWREGGREAVREREVGREGVDRDREREGGCEGLCRCVGVGGLDRGVN
jgi:hypothetical protein